MNEIFGCFHKMLINNFIVVLENHSIHLHTDKVFSPHHVDIRVYMFFYMLFQTDSNFNIFLNPRCLVTKMIIENFIKISWNFTALSASPANGSNIIETEITTATHNNNNQTHQGTLNRRSIIFIFIRAQSTNTFKHSPFINYI